MHFCVVVVFFLVRFYIFIYFLINWDVIYHLIYM